MTDGVRLTREIMRGVFPLAPDTIIAAFIERQGVFSAAGLGMSSAQVDDLWRAAAAL